jgi:hypothetical protein
MIVGRAEELAQLERPVAFVLSVRDPAEAGGGRGHEDLPQLRPGPLVYENSLQVLAHAVPDLTAQVARALSRPREHTSRPLSPRIRR